MTLKVDMTGRQFGRLIVLHESSQRRCGKVTWVCKCDCGKLITVSSNNLQSGHTKSCGCYRDDKLRKVATKHSMYGTRLYSEWAGMKARCYHKAYKYFAHYGGKGITVCDEWKSSFENFSKWALANGYKNDLTLDRKNNDGNYCADNCRWVTMTVQQNNRTNNHRIIFNGENLTLSEWARKLNFPQGLIYQRLKTLKWDVTRALTTPVRGSSIGNN